VGLENLIVSNLKYEKITSHEFEFQSSFDKALNVKNQMILKNEEEVFQELKENEILYNELNSDRALVKN